MNPKTLARIKALEAQRDAWLASSVTEPQASGWFSACIARATDCDVRIRALRAGAASKANSDRARSVARLLKGTV